MQNAKKIFEIRRAKGLTQEFMAESLGISQSTYSKIESGQTQISFPKIQKIASLLEVEPKEILEEKFASVIFQPQFNDSSTNNGHFNYNTTLQESFLNILQNYLQTEQEIKKSFIDELKEARAERKVLLNIIEKRLLA